MSVKWLSHKCYPKSLASAWCLTIKYKQCKGPGSWQKFCDGAGASHGGPSAVTCRPANIAPEADLSHFGFQLCRVYVHPLQAILPFRNIHILYGACPQLIKGFGILQQQYQKFMTVTSKLCCVNICIDSIASEESKLQTMLLGQIFTCSRTPSCLIFSKSSRPCFLPTS